MRLAQLASVSASQRACRVRPGSLTAAAAAGRGQSFTRRPPVYVRSAANSVVNGSTCYWQRLLGFDKVTRDIKNS